MTTNGVLLNPEVMKSLIEAGITRILLSLDAATPETYKKVRPGGDFSVVMNNIETLLEYRRVNNLIIPAVRVSFVVTSLNVHERELFIDTFSDRVDYLEMQGFSTYYDQNSALIPTGAEQIKGFFCNAPWRKLIIRANGDVLPCCTFYGYEIVLGNVLQASIKDIFQGEQCRHLRQEFKKGIYRLSPCLACSKACYKTKEGTLQLKHETPAT
jgi:radical SAM protein with 4Fe4S-binding SPASM domain